MDTPTLYGVKELRKVLVKQASGQLSQGHFRRHIECISPSTTRLERYDAYALTPAQYVVWDSEYQRNDLWGRYPRPIVWAGAFGNLQHSYRHSCGCLSCYWPLLSQHAFKKAPVTGKPSKSFSTIKQGSNEPFAEFIDRLQEAIQRQIENDEAKGELMKKMAVENANADCKRILQPLMNKEGVTLADMFRACTD
ncbi:hypothetical protein E2320_011878, partial [Naja naja]